MPLTKLIIDDDRNVSHRKTSIEYVYLIVGKAFDAHYVPSAMHICGLFVHCFWFSYTEKDNYGLNRVFFFFLLLHRGGSDIVNILYHFYWTSIFLSPILYYNISLHVLLQYCKMEIFALFVLKFSLLLDIYHLCIHFFSLKQLSFPYFLL